MVPHGLPPFSTLRLGLSDDYAAYALQACPALHDTFTESFLAYHKPVVGTMLSMEALVELVILIVFAKTNTSNVESLNSLLRRLLGSRYQTHSMDFVDICSRFILNGVRIR